MLVDLNRFQWASTGRSPSFSSPNPIYPPSLPQISLFRKYPGHLHQTCLLSSHKSSLTSLELSRWVYLLSRKWNLLYFSTSNLEPELMALSLDPPACPMHLRTDPCNSTISSAAAHLVLWVYNYHDEAPYCPENDTPCLFQWFLWNQMSSWLFY